MDIPDDIFDDDDDVDANMNAHARAEETGKEDKKEKVVQSTAVVRALLMKQLSAAALDSPTTAATMGMKKVRAAVAAGQLPARWNKASVMRVGKMNTINGFILMALPDELTDGEKDFMGDDDGLISIFLKATAESLEHCVVHDITKSPMKLAHLFWKLQPDSAIFYDAAFRRFDKVTYKDSACSGWVIDDATLIQAWATYKLTDAGKADSNVSLTVKRRSGARGLSEAKLMVKIGDGFKVAPGPVYVEETVPVFVSGPDEDAFESAFAPCVQAIITHIGASGAEEPRALRSCFYKGFKIAAKASLADVDEVKAKLASLCTRSKTGYLFTLPTEVESYDVKYYASGDEMAAAMADTSGKGAANNNTNNMMEVIGALAAAQQETAERTQAQIDMLAAAATEATNATKDNAKVAKDTHEQLGRSAEATTQLTEEVRTLRVDTAARHDLLQTQILQIGGDKDGGKSAAKSKQPLRARVEEPATGDENSSAQAMNVGGREKRKPGDAAAPALAPAPTVESVEGAVGDWCADTPRQNPATPYAALHTLRDLRLIRTLSHPVAGEEALAVAASGANAAPLSGAGRESGRAVGAGRESVGRVCGGPPRPPPDGAHTDRGEGEGGEGPDAPTVKTNYRDTCDDSRAATASRSNGHLGDFDDGQPLRAYVHGGHVSMPRRASADLADADGVINSIVVPWWVCAESPSLRYGQPSAEVDTRQAGDWPTAQPVQTAARALIPTSYGTAAGVVRGGAYAVEGAHTRVWASMGTHVASVARAENDGQRAADRGEEALGERIGSAIRVVGGAIKQLQWRRAETRGGIESARRGSVGDARANGGLRTQGAQARVAQLPDRAGGAAPHPAARGAHGGATHRLVRTGLDARGLFHFAARSNHGARAGGAAHAAGARVARAGVAATSCRGATHVAVLRPGARSTSVERASGENDDQERGASSDAVDYDPAGATRVAADRATRGRACDTADVSAADVASMRTQTRGRWWHGRERRALRRPTLRYGVDGHIGCHRSMLHDGGASASVLRGASFDEGDRERDRPASGDRWDRGRVPGGGMGTERQGRLCRSLRGRLRHIPPGATMVANECLDKDVGGPRVCGGEEREVQEDAAEDGGVRQGVQDSRTSSEAGGSPSRAADELAGVQAVLGRRPARQMPDERRAKAGGSRGPQDHGGAGTGDRAHAPTSGAARASGRRGLASRHGAQSAAARPTQALPGVPLVRTHLGRDALASAASARAAARGGRAGEQHERQAAALDLGGEGPPRATYGGERGEVILYTQRGAPMRGEPMPLLGVVDETSEPSYNPSTPSSSDEGVGGNRASRDIMRLDAVLAAAADAAQAPVSPAHASVHVIGLAHVPAFGVLPQ